MLCATYRLRELQDQRVKLALDLLEFDQPVEKAMHYACGNTLVTDNLDTAKELAYGKDLSLRVKVISFSFALFHNVHT